MKSKWAKIGSVVGFIIAFYLVEFSPWGSRSIEAFNGGYGTFDMKQYDVKTVYSVLANYLPEGFTRIKYYYLMDFIFIIAFLILQIMIAKLVYKNIKSQIPRKLFIGVALIRGLCDAIENILLYIIITSYPSEHANLVNLSSIFTQTKLRMIPLWGALLLIGIICNHIQIKNQSSKFGKA